MGEQTVTMYCFLDELLLHTRPTWAQPAAPRRRSSDAEVLTMVLIAGRYFGGSPVRRRHYIAQHWGMNRLDNSGFTH